MTPEAATVPVGMCGCGCVHACAYVRACAGVYVCACVCVHQNGLYDPAVTRLYLLVHDVQVITHALAWLAHALFITWHRFHTTPKLTHTRTRPTCLVADTRIHARMRKDARHPHPHSPLTSTPSIGGNRRLGTSTPLILHTHPHPHPHPHTRTRTHVFNRRLRTWTRSRFCTKCRKPSRTAAAR